MLRIIALLSACVFVGPELGRNEEFLSRIIGFSVDTLIAANKLWMYPFWLRPLVPGFIPEYRAVQKQLADMIRFIRPLVESRRSQGQHTSPSNMIDWEPQKCSRAARQGGINYQAIQQLQAGFVAVHTTANLLTDICFNLAARSEYLQPLREELQEALASEGGVLTKNNLAKLRKMDSFVTESLRDRRSS